ncbi:MAG: hypothetical protein JNL67_16575 [Planctomycetaceae bacterium]|nr:hypothetical protein [Planctomycetaceae bacterium]
MARRVRKNSIDPSVVQVVHSWNRCVRGMMLCGVDRATGIDREHRREWSRQRLEHLASVYAIDVLTYAILHNHTHQVLRSRPDIARSWSPETVARRWLMVTPKRDRHGAILEPSEKQILAITSKPELVEKLRLRLSDVSWWMRSYAQTIAVRANREDGSRGHFWESRFRSHVLADQASILRCMLYVDLNPIRAGLAASIEQSDYTGGKDRLDDLRVHLATSNNQITLKLDCGSEMAKWERLDHPCSGWLSPIQIDDQTATEETRCSQQANGHVARGRRTSHRGAVRIPLTKYLLLLDLVGRAKRLDAIGYIPNEVATCLEQLNITTSGFAESVLVFGKRFSGRRNSVAGKSSEPDRVLAETTSAV